MDTTYLIPIGELVEIDTRKVKSLLPEKLAIKINNDNDIKISGYKLTDGNTIGYNLKSKKFEVWIFPEEFSESTREKYNIYIEQNQKEISNIFKNYLDLIFNTSKIQINTNGNKTIGEILNPFYFGKWLIYSAKDII